MNIKKVKKSIETCEEGYAKAKVLAKELELDKVMNIIDIELKKTREGIIRGVHKLLIEAKEDFKKKKDKEASKKEHDAADILNSMPHAARMAVNEQIAAIAKMVGAEGLAKEEDKPEEGKAEEEKEGKEKQKTGKPDERTKPSDDEKKVIDWLDNMVKASKALERSSEKNLDEAKQAFANALIETKNSIPGLIASFPGEDVEKKRQAISEILAKMSDTISKEIESVGVEDIVSARKQILAADQRPKGKEGKKLFRLFNLQIELDSIRKSVEGYKE